MSQFVFMSLLCFAMMHTTSTLLLIGTNGTKDFIDVLMEETVLHTQLQIIKDLHNMINYLEKSVFFFFFFLDLSRNCASFCFQAQKENFA